ncbi:hypothetical protein HWI79_179 [Cryptosporidium felis]|nr:hypothetical protein HWI79_179 [Cryptosporidium felis]
MRILNFLLVSLLINGDFVFSKHRKHDSGLRGGNQSNGTDKKCTPETCQGNITLAGKIYCKLNDLLENRTNISGTILFNTGSENTFKILENTSGIVIPAAQENVTILRNTDEIFDHSVIDVLENGSFSDNNSQINKTIGNISISTLFLDAQSEIFAAIDKLPDIYNFENNTFEIDSGFLIDSLVENGTLDSSKDLESEVLDEFGEEFNSTVGILEEISEQFPDLRELSKILRGEKDQVSIGELLFVTQRLIRSLNTMDGDLNDIDDASFDKLNERLSDTEIERLKEQQLTKNITTVKKPWYGPLKTFGIEVISGKNAIFSAIISVIESIVGHTPIGAIVTIIVRIIAAIVTIIHEIIIKKKKNSNLVRTLRHLDDFEALQGSKVSVASKIVGRISGNVEEIRRSQLLLRTLYMDLSELAHEAEKNLYNFEEEMIKDQLDRMITGTLSNMFNNSSTFQNVASTDLSGGVYGNRILSSSVLKYNINGSFSSLADEIEDYLNQSYLISWEQPVSVRDLGMDEVIHMDSMNPGSDNSTSTSGREGIVNSTSIVTTTSTTATQQTKVKWYDGLIQFSKRVSELSGVVSMLDMLLELFTTIFANSPQAESILSILRLIVYLIKSVFSIFSNISSNRKLINTARLIPDKIVSDRRLLQLTTRRIQENIEAIQLERGIISSQLNEIIRISEPNDSSIVDKEFDEYLTLNTSDSFFNSTEDTFGPRVHVSRSYIDERILSVSGSTVLAAELNFKSWMEKVGSFFDNSYEKIKQLIKGVFSSIFKGNKIVTFIDKLIDLIISVIRSIYHAFKNKSTQRLLIQTIEECEEYELRELLLRQLENTLKSENNPIIKLLL